MKKTKVIAVILVVVVAGLAGAFVIAEYLELFGSINWDGFASIPWRFKIQDRASGKAVTGVAIRSYMAFGADVSDDFRIEFEQQPDAEGVVHGRVEIFCSGRRTWLFEKSSSLKSGRDDHIEFVFSHPSYATEARTFTIRQLANVQSVELTPQAGDGVE